MATLDQVTQAVKAGSRARALIASQSPALLGQIRMPAYALDPNNSRPQVNPQAAPNTGGSQLEGGGNSGSGPYGPDNPNAGLPGFDDNGMPLAGYDINGKKIAENSNIPPGWVVNPQTGGLIPPGSGQVAGAGIPVGELFGVGDTVYRWNGKTITKATAAETKTFGGPWIDTAGVNGSNAYASEWGGSNPNGPSSGNVWGIDMGDASGGAGGGVGGGGGGGGSPYAAAQLDLQQQQFQHTLEQDRLQNILDVLNATRQQQVLMTQARDNAQSALINAAPNLNDGRQYFGGYEPGGPAQALAQFGGYAFTPQPLHTVPITFNPNPVAVDPATQAILDRILGAQQP